MQAILIADMQGTKDDKVFLKTKYAILIAGETIEWDWDKLEELMRKKLSKTEFKEVFSQKIVTSIDDKAIDKYMKGGKFTLKQLGRVSNSKPRKAYLRYYDVTEKLDDDE